MSIYRYPESKVIDEVAFVTSENGACRGYLHAANGTDGKTLQDIEQALQDRGLSAIPGMMNDIPVLEVRKIKNAPELISLLQQKGWVSGQPQIKADAKKKQTFMDKIRDHSLQGTGACFILADTGFTYYGFKEKRWEDVAAGLAYMAGSATMAFFGHSDQSNIEIRKQARKLLNYARDYNLRIDPDDAIKAVSEAKDAGPGARIIDIFKEYPAEIGNTITGFAGMMIAISAAKSRVFKKFDPETVGREVIENNKREGKILKPEDAKLSVKELGAKTIRKKRLAGRMDMGLGATTLTAGLTGALVDEKVPDPDAPKSHGIQGVLDWVQERPLRVSGFGYMISTLCHAVSTAVEYKDAKMTQDRNSREAIPGRIAFIAFTLIGEILLAISSKGHGEGVKVDKSTDNSIIALAAALIVKQPENMQEGLIDKLSKFLGRADVLAIKDQDAQDQLRAQVEQMRKNPWAGERASPEKTDNGVKQHAGTDRVPKPLPAWQSKISASPSDQQPTLSV